jgi:hypothetical protein
MTTGNWMDTAPLAHSDVVVLDYLAALWAESDDLPPDLRDELMASVTEYIAMRRTAVSDPLSDPEQVVGRLGPPEALVAAARRGHLPPHLRHPAIFQPPAPPRAANVGAGAAEYAAIGLLTGGAVVLPVAGPLAGLLLASGSPRWTTAQKAVAWVLTGGSMGFAMLLTMIAAVAAEGGTTVALVVAFLVLVAGPVAAGLSLIHGMNDRRPSRE